MSSSYSKKFASIYSENWNDFSSAVFKYFKKYLNNKDNCDLACGTGNFIKLAKHICKSITGIDASKDFITFAKKTNPKIKFKNTKAEDLCEKENYDVITCFYDSINHFDNWQKVFKNIYLSLKKDGVFIFDFNTIAGLKHWHNSWTNETEKYIIKMSGKYKNNNQAEMSVKVFNKNLKPICQEKIFEKTYSLNQIKQMLKKSGFKKIKTLGNVLNQKNKGRMFVVCGK